jgi:hypothetical protein
MSDTSDFKPGDRVRLNALGKERLPRTRVQTGTVINVPNSKLIVRVMLDGQKTLARLHRSYIEIDDERR